MLGWGLNIHEALTYATYFRCNFLSQYIPVPQEMFWKPTICLHYSFSDLQKRLNIFCWSNYDESGRDESRKDESGKYFCSLSLPPAHKHPHIYSHQKLPPCIFDRHTHVITRLLPNEIYGILGWSIIWNSRPYSCWGILDVVLNKVDVGRKSKVMKLGKKVVGVEISKCLQKLIFFARCFDGVIICSKNSHFLRV